MTPDDTPGASSRPGHLEPGEVVGGRYVVGPLIGYGGMARVYRGRDPEIGREVAIKVLNITTSQTDAQHEAVVERFRREARVAASIKHRCVVSVYDVGITGSFDQPYIVMDLLEGKTLDEWLSVEGAMDAARLIPLFVEVLEALGEGHALGIVHKDLKPANLFFSQPGSRQEHIQILDFGIAREGSEGRLTATGQVTGTPQYLAPEYIATQRVTSALDVYQMGLILVELLSGRTVVDEESMLKCVMVHSNHRLTIPDHLTEGPLGEVISRAVSFDPDARFADANEFAAALAAVDPNTVATSIRKGRASTASSVSSTAAAAGHPSPPPMRGTRRLVFILLTTLVLLVGAGFAAVALLSPISDDDWRLSMGGTHQEAVAVDGSRAPVEPSREDSNRGTSSPQPDTPGIAGAADATPDSDASAGSGETTGARVEVKILGPAGARVLRDGEVIGTGSALVEFPAGDAPPVTLRISRSGYRTKKIVVRPTDAPVLEVRLSANKAVLMP